MRKSYFLPLIGVLFVQGSCNPAFGSASIQYNNYEFRNTLIEHKHESNRIFKKDKLEKVKDSDRNIFSALRGYQHQDNKINDNQLAQEAENIDLIIRERPSMFLDALVIRKNKLVQYVTINQVGFAGIFVRKFCMKFSSIPGEKLAHAAAITTTKKTEE